MMSGRSAIIEDGDGEMTVPPVLTPVTEIFSPLSNLLAIPSPSQDTWLLNSFLGGQDVTGPQSANFPSFAKGRWDIEVTLTVQFEGARNINSQVSLGINDPFVSTQNVLSCGMVGVVGVQYFTTRLLRMLFITDGWLFVHSTPALVLGDKLTSAANVYARRVF